MECFEIHARGKEDWKTFYCSGWRRVNSLRNLMIIFQYVNRFYNFGENAQRHGKQSTVIFYYYFLCKKVPGPV